MQPAWHRPAASCIHQCERAAKIQGFSVTCALALTQGQAVESVAPGLHPGQGPLSPRIATVCTTREAARIWASL